MPKVSIVIPAYNEEKYIGRLLASLQKLPLENILEIIVVDNCSVDKTKEIVLSAVSFLPKLRLIDESRKGVAWARTRGVKESSGEIIAFLDADTYVSEKWLKMILDVFFAEKFSRKNIVCLSGPTYFDGVSLFHRFFTYIFWWIATFTIYQLTGYMGIFANLVVRSESLKKIGGIDTKVEFYGDDTNITRRLSKVGRVLFLRSFFVYASGRRFDKEGLVATTWRYGINFFSEAIVHKPVTKGYTEVR